MSSRQAELSQLQDYIKEVDKEVTMILQSLQWDRKLLLQSEPKSTCKYNFNHKVPPEKLKEHEEKCYLKSQDYAKDDIFLPDPFDPNSSTVLKLSSEDIKEVINYASKTDPLFKRGIGNMVIEPPLTAERLQASYTADERRAIYDVAVNAVPSCFKPPELTLAGELGDQSHSTPKSKIEHMAELRDLRRRRAKYRVAARSTNYSHALRAVIDAQMEMYTEPQDHTRSKSHDNKTFTKYRNNKEDRTDKHFGNTSKNNMTKEDSGPSKHIKIGYDERNNKHEEYRNSRKEIDRYENKERDKYKSVYNEGEYKRRQEINRNSYKDDRDNRKYEKRKSEGNGNYCNNREDDRYSSSFKDNQSSDNETYKKCNNREDYTEQRLGSESKIITEKDSRPSKHIKTEHDEKNNKHDEYRNSDKEIDRYENSNKERGKYKSVYNGREYRRRQDTNRNSYKDDRDSKKYDKRKSEGNRKYYNSREEGERYSSSSKDNQRYRDREKEKRLYRDRSSDRYRSDKTERTHITYDDVQIKEEREDS